jgi:hypothetical protein
MGQVQGHGSALDKTRLRESIADAFAQVPRPAERDYTADVGGEGYEESSAFFGKRWQELAPDFLHTYRDVLFWFTPAAFHYYLPAFLRASLDTDDPNAIYVGTLLSLLRADAEDSFSRARWGRLNDAQIAVLRDWLGWLAGKAPPDHVLEREVSEAMEAVSERYWWL